MNVVCLDLEGVLVPEIWIAFSEVTGIPELRRTTRDEPDYDKLMQFRMDILRERGLGIHQIQDTIAKIDPLEGALEFLNSVREIAQVIILSDTFTQFATPLMKKLAWPTLLCNSLIIDNEGMLTGFKMRADNGKKVTVDALKSVGCHVLASGDSYNDLGMISSADAGYFFRTTDKIKNDHPRYPAFETYQELLDAVKEFVKRPV